MTLRFGRVDQPEKRQNGVGGKALVCFGALVLFHVGKTCTGAPTPRNQPVFALIAFAGWGFEAQCPGSNRVWCGGGVASTVAAATAKKIYVFIVIVLLFCGLFCLFRGWEGDVGAGGLYRLPTPSYRALDCATCIACKSTFHVCSDWFPADAGGPKSALGPAVV